MFNENDHILITGGTGFFGKALLRHFETYNQAAPLITILSRNPKQFIDQYPDLAKKAKWLKGDVLEPQKLPRNKQFSHILHAATDSTIGPIIRPIDRYVQIVEGTRNILDYANLTGVKRFLLTSSGGVYGPQPNNIEFIPEDYFGMPDPLIAGHAYSVAKRCAEHLCALYRDQHGLNTVIARCFTFAGRDLPFDAHFAIGNFVRDAINNSKIHVSGDGKAIRSYMDQRDLSNWLLTLLCFGHPGEAYNVGSDNALTIADLAEKVRDLISPGKEVMLAEKQTAHKDFRNRYVPSIQKAYQQLGLTTTYRLEDSIKSMASPKLVEGAHYLHINNHI